MAWSRHQERNQQITSEVSQPWDGMWMEGIV